ncbi:formimidoylglutamase [Marinobacter sp. BSs20148]|jgi:formiminoglutamase|uniref:formimidoylglutamase n=1 Tax=Marinobacter sp. BSs20148 TaxID=490759 RepID=UPI0002776C0D|nr:formimidoylglutamase [Marinobacter sp. BSs20148]AFP31026.1 Formimidoylglutamase [Marinobacter sp. BSs20148]
MTSFIEASDWHGRFDPEDGDESIRWHQRVVTQAGADKQAQSGLIGFASDAGIARNKGRIGAAQGPFVLRDQLKNLAWHGGNSQVVDFGTVTVDDGRLEAGQTALAAAVSRALPKVARLLVVGGGHETAWGTFNGLIQAFDPASTRIGIINLDAHFDLRKVGEQGPSSGTPFYQMAERLGADDFHYCCLGVSRTSNTPALFQRADDLGVSYMEDWQMQPDRMSDIKQRLRTFCESLDLIYLTIDLDVLPHYQAPGVSAPAARGVPLIVVEGIIDEILSIVPFLRHGMPLVEMCELNPIYDVSGMTARTAALLANTLLCSRTLA